VEWSGVEWSGVEWSGVEWSGVEWSGVEWSGVGWRGVGGGGGGGRGGAHFIAFPWPEWCAALSDSVLVDCPPSSGVGSPSSFSMGTVGGRDTSPPATPAPHPGPGPRAARARGPPSLLTLYE